MWGSTDRLTLWATAPLRSDGPSWESFHRWSKGSTMENIETLTNGVPGILLFNDLQHRKTVAWTVSLFQNPLNSNGTTRKNWPMHANALSSKCAYRWPPFHQEYVALFWPLQNALFFGINAEGTPNPCDSQFWSISIISRFGQTMTNPNFWVETVWLISAEWIQALCAT